MSELRCVECGRRAVTLSDGTALHRLPTPAGALDSIQAQREWGMEIGLFTIATAGHTARVALNGSGREIREYGVSDPRD